jgi:hypothetical protein
VVALTTWHLALRPIKVGRLDPNGPLLMPYVKSDRFPCLTTRAFVRAPALSVNNRKEVGPSATRRFAESIKEFSVMVFMVAMFQSMDFLSQGAVRSDHGTFQD